jgi:hypothetical protein
LRDTKITVFVLAPDGADWAAASILARAIGQLGPSFSCLDESDGWCAETGTTQQSAARRSNFLVCVGIAVLLDGQS